MSHKNDDKMPMEVLMGIAFKKLDENFNQNEAKRLSGLIVAGLDSKLAGDSTGAIYSIVRALWLTLDRMKERDTQLKVYNCTRFLIASMDRRLKNTVDRAVDQDIDRMIKSGAKTIPDANALRQQLSAAKEREILDMR